MRETKKKLEVSHSTSKLTVIHLLREQRRKGVVEKQRENDQLEERLELAYIKLQLQEKETKNPTDADKNKDADAKAVAEFVFLFLFIIMYFCCTCTLHTVHAV